MILHPSIHLEIARQRHQDMLARAEPHWIANACDHAGATPTVRRRLLGAIASRRASKPEIVRHPDVETGLEV